jgi:hypothetical protein
MRNEERIFAAISILSGIVTLSIVVWVLLKYPSEQVLGERFIKDEIRILPIFRIYFKPITIIVISTFVFWMCTLEALRKYITKLPMLIKRLIFISFCVIAFVFSYEVIWNFLMWTSAHIINPNLPLDSLYHQMNLSMRYPINFVEVTKLYSLYLVISLYSIFFFYANMKEKRNQEI